MKKRKAIIVDIDGTLAKRVSDRDPYDETRVGEDALHLPVAECVAAMHKAGYEILVTSGRSDFARRQTESWLTFQNVEYHELFMRRAGDTRHDTEVKEEIYRELIWPHYNVVFALDDRDSVVARWRELGIVCFQVAPGNF